MIGSCLRLRPRPQAAAQFDAGQARQHPVEHDQVGHPLLQPGVGVVAAADGFDIIAFGIEVVAQQRGQRFLVFHHQNARAHIAVSPPVVSLSVPGTVVAKVVMSPFGRLSRICWPSIM